MGATACCNICTGPIQILDLGSATGNNSARELRAAVQAIRQSKGGAEREIVITHIDTTSNDWNQLLRTVSSSPDTYLAGSEAKGVYSHASAKSFYEQVAPTASVALAYSGVAFHWLSDSKPMSDGVNWLETTDQEAYLWNKRQAARDWVRLLQMRARELIPGGYLIATASTLKGSESFAQSTFWAWEGFKEAAEQGLIGEQEFRAFAYMFFSRSQEEWLAPFHGEMAGLFEVMHFAETTIADPHWAAYQNSSDPEPERKQALAEGYWKTVAAVAGGMVRTSLTQKSHAEVQQVVEVMKQRYIRNVISCPAEHTAPFALIVLRRK